MDFVVILAFSSSKINYFWTVLLDFAFILKFYTLFILK